MNEFESALKEGNLIVAECTRCHQVVWPPSKFCNICHVNTKFRDSSKTGIVIEFSKNNGMYFGLIELEKNLRFLGSIMGDKPPQINQKVQLEECSFNKVPKFVFKIINN